MSKKTVEEEVEYDNYDSVSLFVSQFSYALEGYLKDLYSDGGDVHITDLAVATSSFAEAFFHISSNF